MSGSWAATREATGGGRMCAPAHPIQSSPRRPPGWAGSAMVGLEPLQVRTRTPVRLLLLVWCHHEARGKGAPHLLELCASGHLLSEERGLDAVEQSFEPADELSLRYTQLRLAWRGVLGERER